MGKGRLEAFSDGVLAIIITIMVLELKAPEENAEWSELVKLWPKFLAYLLSFIYVGIYWINHHHLFHSVTRVNGVVLWANLALLFCLSLVPFAADWMGETSFSANPVMLYGMVLVLCGICYKILYRALYHIHDEDSVLHLASEKKGALKATISINLQIAGVIVAYFYPSAGMVLYAIVVIWWVVPNRKVEDLLKSEANA